MSFSVPSEITPGDLEMSSSKSGKKVYQRAWVYKLWCPNCPGQFYVGSTSMTLKERFKHHRSDCKNPNQDHYNCPLYCYIREHGGIDEWGMEVLEECCDLTLDELHQRERVFYDELQPALNKWRPWLSEEEKIEGKREKRRQRYWDNPEAARESARRWRETNPEAARETDRQRYWDNPEASRKKRRRWQKANPEKVKANNDKRHALAKLDLVWCWTCRDCLMRRDSFKNHCETKTHLRNLLKWALAIWRDA